MNSSFLSKRNPVGKTFESISAEFSLPLLAILNSINHLPVSLMTGGKELSIETEDVLVPKRRRVDVANYTANV